MLIYLLNLFTFNEMELFQKVCAEVDKSIHEDYNLAAEKEIIPLSISQKVEKC